MGNIKGMYDGIKTALRLVQSKAAPLKSSTRVVIADKGQQIERWVEHYSNFYSRENTVFPSAIYIIECLLTMNELDIEPMVEEVNKAINSLASGKGTAPQDMSDANHHPL